MPGTRLRRRARAAAAPGRLDVTLRRLPLAAHEPLPAATAPLARRPWHGLTNNPLLGKLHRALAPALAERLRATLPDYMVPAAWVTQIGRAHV